MSPKASLTWPTFAIRAAGPRSDGLASGTTRSSTWKLGSMNSKAVSRSPHFFVPEGDVVVSSYTALGIGLLVIAALQLLIGFGILARVRAAQVIGLIVVIMGAIVQLGFFKHYPAWAAIILVLDAVIIYALTVHADEFAGARRPR